MKRMHCIRYGEAVAIDMFVTMINPKNQGTKFKWENFPDMVNRIATTSLFSSMREGTPTDKEKKLCGDTAKKWAERAIKKAGLNSNE